MVVVVAVVSVSPAVVVVMEAEAIVVVDMAATVVAEAEAVTDQEAINNNKLYILKKLSKKRSFFNWVNPNLKFACKIFEVFELYKL